MANQLKNLMQGLYYPAITGTSVVLVLYRATMHESPRQVVGDYAFGYGVLFVLFFSASYVAISTVKDQEYLLWEFALDLVEVVCIFYVFYFLGLFDTNTVREPRFQGIYIAVASLAIFQALWRRFLLDDHGRDLWILRTITFAIAATGAFWLFRYSWFNLLALVAYFALVVQYIRVLLVRSRPSLRKKRH